MSITPLLSEQLLLDLAGPASFERGYEYFRRDLVESLDVVADDAVRAIVAGTNRYTTQLRASGNRVTAACTCPVGVQGLVCKHAVATGLALIAESGGDITERAPSPQRHRATRQSSTGARREPQRIGDAKDVRSRLQVAMRLSGHLDWRQTTRWAARALDAIDSIEPLIATNPDDAIVLCEYGLKRCDAVYGRIDDSGGELTTLTERIETLHHEACAQASPDPVALARRLYRLETQSELDLLVGAFSDYADVLGIDGQAEYRQLAEQDWHALDGRNTPDSYETGGDWDHVERVRRVAAALAQIARADRDVTRLVEVVGRHLAHAGSFARLAIALAEIDAMDDAHEWILRGLDQDGSHRTLLMLAIESHQRRGETAQATECAWSLFVAGQRTSDFDRLLEIQDDPSSRDALRERALAHARDVAVKRDYATFYVELLLHVERIDDALVAVDTFSCNLETRLRLAAMCEITHPDRAALLYLDAADARIESANRQGYEHGIELLARADALLVTESGRVTFNERIANIRTRHHRKRSLMAMIDRRAW